MRDVADCPSGSFVDYYSYRLSPSIYLYVLSFQLFVLLQSHDINCLLDLQKKKKKQVCSGGCVKRNVLDSKRENY